MLPTFEPVLFTAVTHARSDRISNITAGVRNPIHCFAVSRRLFGWATGGTKSKSRGLSNSGRTEEAGTRDF